MLEVRGTFGATHGEGVALLVNQGPNLQITTLHKL